MYLLLLLLLLLLKLLLLLLLLLKHCKALSNINIIVYCT